MKVPLLLVDHGDISVFSSNQDLEKYAESPDIAGYSAFDAAGYQLDLQSVMGRIDTVVDVNPVRLVEVGGVPQPNLLRDSIRSFLNRVNVPTSDDDDLSKLIGVLVETIGYTK